METTTDKLVRDMKTVVTDAEDLLKATANQGGEQIARIRTRAEESLRVAQARIKELTQAAEARVRVADEQVHEHPWTAVGVAAGIGVLLGFMLGRK
jgi:ElaB/YqjD/DUF883 family membrane-anchored ribosome-binding protein